MRSSRTDLRNKMIHTNVLELKNCRRRCVLKYMGKNILKKIIFSPTKTRISQKIIVQSQKTQRQSFYYQILHTILNFEKDRCIMEGKSISTKIHLQILKNQLNAVNCKKKHKYSLHAEILF